jgi:hypothetical protein
VSRTGLRSSNEKMCSCYGYGTVATTVLARRCYRQNANCVSVGFIQDSEELLYSRVANYYHKSLELLLVIVRWKIRNTPLLASTSVLRRSGANYYHKSFELLLVISTDISSIIHLTETC